MCTDFIATPFALLGLILFYRSKTLPEKSISFGRTLSIIIPARNEEANLPVLLDALTEDKPFISEIIVVNDGSTDNTAQCARSRGATVIETGNRPQGWAGKPFACYSGAQRATGEVLLFLDADVIPQPGMTARLLANHESGSVLSVQPYHYTEKMYEQASLFFNAVAVAGVGLCLPGTREGNGLFGPVLMMERNLYFETGGHELVKNEVLEDYQFGVLLQKKGIRRNLFLGGGTVSYRMYKGGIADLVWGWSKNFAGGAAKTPLSLLAPVILWLISYYSIAIGFIQGCVAWAAGTGSAAAVLPFFAAYACAGILLYAGVKKIGSFSAPTCLLYVFPLAVFTLIFALSLLLRTVIKKVRWKGRWIQV